MLLYLILAIAVLLAAAVIYRPAGGPPRCAGCGKVEYLMQLDGRPICVDCYNEVEAWNDDE